MKAEQVAMINEYRKEKKSHDRNNYLRTAHIYKQTYGNNIDDDMEVLDNDNGQGNSADV